ncbi:hypothetical protein [Archangium violaceum]|uniref:Capsule assembly Wzi family protein n=1 Tax=Archangium violaceum Cb vi76 TaxID=1406225 RepID=A0A084SE90_9BACT|nr:hypothetical protein [Archangium violaceum]KFA86775.1 hypothetical protein Q664_52205 [Archangium violaceum Cb vi76]
MLRRPLLIPWRSWLGALGLWAAFPGSARATETDQYFAIDKPPRDSLEVLNEKINRDILGALALVNRRASWDQYSCQDVAHRVYQRFRISGLHKIELWAENSPRIDRVPTQKDHRRFEAHSSIYRNARLWDWGLSFGVKATFTVAGVHMGADKLSHFFQTGWKYHQRFREFMKQGVPEREALERIIRYGVETESGPLGSVTTGVFSFGDLEANYQGFLFYRSLCRDEDPRLLKTPQGWRLTRPFDWRDYVSPQFDETVNNSAFVPMRWEEVRANLRRDYCPRLDSETFLEHYRSSARYPRKPDDFNIRYVRELLARGEVPRQQDFSIWAACGRSPPDLAQLAAETGGSAGAGPEHATTEPLTPTPRYEAPVFDEALLRPLFELGGGGFRNDGSAWNALLRTRFLLHETVGPEDTWDAVRTPEYLLWASLDGHLALGSSPAGVTVPYADLRFTPVQRRFELNNVATGEELAVGVVLLPLRLTRFLALDRSLGVETSVIGVRARLGRRFGERQRTGVFGAVALDSPGYKSALHPSDGQAFQGVHAATLALETGAELQLGTQLRLGLLLGGSASLGLGWDRGGSGFSAPADLEAHAEAQVDVTRFSRLFVRGQLEAILEPGRNRLLSTPVLLGGATFRY